MAIDRIRVGLALLLTVAAVLGVGALVSGPSATATVAIAHHTATDERP